MNQYYVSKFSVEGLWGRKSYPLRFNEDVNIIIGPNASGKTTLINILYDALSGNFVRLGRTEFTAVNIELRGFNRETTQYLNVVRTGQKMSMSLGDEQRIDLPLELLHHVPEDFEYDEMSWSYYSSDLIGSYPEVLSFRRELRRLVPAVLLPVSRKLPIAEEDERERRHPRTRPLESVDQRLLDLRKNLSRYYAALSTKLSELRRKFQGHALENILYDRRHDRIEELSDSFREPSEEDKDALLNAFQDVGLSGQQIERRIDQHFEAAREAILKLNKMEGGEPLEVNTAFIIPLVNRTREMVKFAQALEEERRALFAAIHSYENIVNSFLNEKDVRVSDHGELDILLDTPDGDLMNWRYLSSGEKQILILLTQALLARENPVVYVADEPELSLHVSWQEKLLEALTTLAGRCQLIVATHSPDIVSTFGEKVIDLAKYRQ